MLESIVSIALTHSHFIFRRLGFHIFDGNTMNKLMQVLGVLISPVQNMFKQTKLADFL
jgi:hypothetical protein